MKKVKFLLTILIGILLFTNLNVQAKELTDEEYNLLRNIYSDNMISVMSDEQIEKALTYDLAHPIKDTVYYKGVSYGNNQSYTWTEITEEEYNREKDISTIDTSVSTTYKTVSLYVVMGTDGRQYLFNLDAVWNAIPTTRSYDVIAFRFNDIAIINGSQVGTQYFREAGKSSGEIISYSTDGTNIKKIGNNFGISMNIVNNDIEELEFNINATGIASGSHPQVWGSYQHAAVDVTLAESQNYNISQAGKGGVINFAASVTNKYDGMRGVNADLF